MAVIKIDTSQIDSIGSQFHVKSSEIETLITQSRSLMSSLQGQFMGQRASKIFTEWEDLQPNLLNAVESLQIAGDLLKRSAMEFSAVDSTY